MYYDVCEAFASQPVRSVVAMTTDLETLLPDIADLILDPVFVVDEEGRLVFVSAACEQVLGYTQDELIGASVMDLVHPEDREQTRTAAERIMRGDSHVNFENRYISKDGHVVHFMWSARWSDKHRIRVGVARDVTSLKRAEQVQDAQYWISEAAYTAESLDQLYAEIHRVICQLLPAENFCVAMYERLAGTLSYPYLVDERVVPSTSDPMSEGAALARIIREGSGMLLHASDVTGAGATQPSPQHPPNWLGMPLIADDEVIGALVVHSRGAGVRYTEDDRQLLQFVSTQVATAIQRKQSEASLRHMAHYDALTDLPNRTLLYDRLDMAVRRTLRNGECVGLLYLDLNDFKMVNDAYGHETGDALLRGVARRLEDGLRDSDTVARIGGDEFTVLLTDIRSADAVDGVAEKILHMLSQPFELHGHTLTITASIGRAVYPDDGADRESLLRKADAEMYAGKRHSGVCGSR